MATESSNRHTEIKSAFEASLKADETLAQFGARVRSIVGEDGEAPTLSPDLGQRKLSVFEHSAELVIAQLLKKKKSATPVPQPHFPAAPTSHTRSV